jgi:hypothetical protein
MLVRQNSITAGGSIIELLTSWQPGSRETEGKILDKICLSKAYPQ